MESKPKPGDVWLLAGTREPVIVSAYSPERQHGSSSIAEAVFLLHRTNEASGVQAATPLEMLQKKEESSFTGLNIFDLLSGDLSAWIAATEVANRPFDGISFAPWTDAQVEILNAFQQRKDVHPFTCGSEDYRQPLIAEKDGWHCPSCDYRQDWCYNFMLDPTP